MSQSNTHLCIHHRPKSELIHGVFGPVQEQFRLQGHMATHWETCDEIERPIAANMEALLRQLQDMLTQGNEIDMQ